MTSCCMQRDCTPSLAIPLHNALGAWNKMKAARSGTLVQLSVNENNRLGVSKHLTCKLKP